MKSFIVLSALYLYWHCLRYASRMSIFARMTDIAAQVLQYLCSTDRASGRPTKDMDCVSA